ncbi:phosphoribosylformylglycinamidine synthase [Candidatus Methylomirabilis lanthanidiphila]|uniref:Phosphoribosylformylglycinamidine synthase subunit PurL n=1 Tax=Candidatus Methylomirabilis lanthanidiphila TaxID=2211376 RepID=A0A564ZH46_9BACT|nr:phosphoribosylformylglycinamidine synthase subunit PurL [Candidatus Methylomirabilis lanthanidiphila]VUZ84446.1 phosphoribosylformylglycinamidine synthase [Candidatus Methylomirabilis lanthanidiphila]
MTVSVMSPDLIASHGLTTDEYDRIVAMIGREPNLVELGMFGAMWSEHCSYKSSRVHLATLPTEGPRILQGPGENAGIIDIGDGLALVFKMESHNHPSFIEPYQGAATGVGGIIRDIFTMGARPIALCDSLRFGPLTDPKNRYLFSRVVAGIAGYGNAVGVPTVGGEVGFAEPYSGNPLVNVLCVGIARKDRLFFSGAGGIDNPVIYVGAKTGRDGIHGATMASGVFDEGAEARRPTVQVGDPFREKLLIEACLELMAGDDLVAVQDMGAAGLTCATAEMAARGGTGIEIDLARVPRREPGMTAYELMLSESQERMLVVAKAGSEERVRTVFEKWDLDAAVIGRVTEGGLLRVLDHGSPVAEIPAGALASDAPAYHRPSSRPAEADARQRLDLDRIPLPDDYAAVLLELLRSPNLCCKERIWERYDHMLFLGTIVGPGSDAVVLRLPGGGRRAIALSVDGNGRYCTVDPYRGAMIAVAEAARNVVCAGGEPLAITNCLNFGNPERPEIMWQFVEAVKGIGEACRALQTPVTGGNVSLYNETSGNAIFPTPMIGMVGLLDDVSYATGQWFKCEGDLVALIGETRAELGASEYLATRFDLVQGEPPSLDLAKERAVQRVCLEAIRAGIISSAHDCSDGGLAIALAESCLGPTPIGVDVQLTDTIRPDALLFGESQSRIVVSLKAADWPRLEAIAAAHQVPVARLGTVGGTRFQLRAPACGVELSVAEIESAWRSGLAPSLGA